MDVGLGARCEPLLGVLFPAPETVTPLCPAATNGELRVETFTLASFPPVILHQFASDLVVRDAQVTTALRRRFASRLSSPPAISTMTEMFHLFEITKLLDYL